MLKFHPNSKSNSFQFSVPGEEFFQKKWSFAAAKCLWSTLTFSPPVSSTHPNRPKSKMAKITLPPFLWLLTTLLLPPCIFSFEWKHILDLDDDFRLSWTPNPNDVTFEVQVRSLGYFGLGFTRRDEMEAVDMVIGWMDEDGNAHLEVKRISH